MRPQQVTKQAGFLCPHLYNNEFNGWAPKALLVLWHSWVCGQTSGNHLIKTSTNAGTKLFSQGVLSYKTFETNPEERPKVVRLEIGLGNQEIAEVGVNWLLATHILSPCLGRDLPTCMKGELVKRLESTSKPFKSPTFYHCPGLRFSRNKCQEC